MYVHVCVLPVIWWSHNYILPAAPSELRGKRVTCFARPTTRGCVGWGKHGDTQNCPSVPLPISPLYLALFLLIPPSLSSIPFPLPFHLLPLPYTLSLPFPYLSLSPIPPSLSPIPPSPLSLPFPYLSISLPLPYTYPLSLPLTYPSLSPTAPSPLSLLPSHLFLLLLYPSLSPTFPSPSLSPTPTPYPSLSLIPPFPLPLPLSLSSHSLISHSSYHFHSVPRGRIFFPCSALLGYQRATPLRGMLWRVC